MFTKERLLSMNYKELVVLAKQHGVHKSRSKKVYLLKQLLPLADNELLINQKTKAHGSTEESIIDRTIDETIVTDMISISTAQLRRETFDVNPYSIGESVINKAENESSITKKTGDIPASLRRETFDIDQRLDTNNVSIIDRTGVETSIILNSIIDGAAGKKSPIKEKKSFRLAPRRRETFEVNPRDSITMSAEPANISSDPEDNSIIDGAAGKKSPIKEKKSFRLAPRRRETFEVNPRDSITMSAEPANISSDPEDNSIIDGAAGKKSPIKEKKSFRLAPRRRETFEVNPRDSITMSAEPANISSDPEDSENISHEETGRISILRQNTFSIDKPKENSNPAKACTLILRQNTFNVDNKETIDEMPGLICKETTNRPTMRPFSIKESPRSLVKFRSPIRTRNSMGVGNVRSIAQRLEKLSANRELRPSSREAMLQKTEGAGTPARVHKTAIKGGRIQKKITPRKLPNFKAIHMREFSKMESIVDHTQRKAERTKNLMTPVKLNSIPGLSSRIPVKFDSIPKVIDFKPVTPAMPIKPIVSTHNRGQSAASEPASVIKSTMGLRKSHGSNLKDKLKLIDSPMTKLRRKSATAATAVASKENLLSNTKKRINNVKEIVSAKSHPFSVERNRVKERDLLKTVRTNRRFQLQMEVMRKAKVQQ